MDKNIREAYYYSKTPGGTKCLLCPNICRLKPGDIGLCHNRINIGNKIFTLAYGNPSAVNIDPIEKKPLFHFYPGSEAYSIGTAGCTMSCLNCQNWQISQTSPSEIQNYDLMPESVVQECIKHSCKSIAYTYNEPLSYYEYTYDTALIAKSKGIKNVLVSNGYIANKPMRKLCKVLDAANIDLKSFSDDVYIKLGAGKLNPVLNTLQILKNEGVWLEITNLIIPGWTDDLQIISRMCDWLVANGFAENPIHFSRFFPQYKLKETSPTPVETMVKARKIAMNAGCKYVYLGNISGTTSDNTICPGCGKIIVERNGYTIKSNYVVNNSCKFCKKMITGFWD